jgi:hypothetical protein
MTMTLRTLGKLAHSTATTLFGAAVLAMLTAATPEPRAATGSSVPCPKTGAKVVITALGNVTLNDALVPVDNLAAALNALTPRPSEVCYFREKPKGEAPAAVRIAINAIISTRLPIAFFSDATFSTRVDMPTQH